jgi:hypothetical protein
MIVSHSAVRLGRRAVAVAVLAFAVAAPASAHAVVDLGISQVASASRVHTGKTITYTATVTNHGSESVAHAYASLFSNRPGSVIGADENPYQSVVAAQGTCGLAPSADKNFPNAVCDVGPLAPGQSADVVAVARIGEAAEHNARLAGSCASIDPPSCFYTYEDADPSNDWVEVSTAVVSGSKKISIQGLPDPCASSDFTFTAKAKGKVKRIAAEVQGPGVEQDLGKAKGKRLSATVPLAPLVPDRSYEITVTAKPADGKTLKAAASFERCKT